MTLEWALTVSRRLLLPCKGSTLAIELSARWNPDPASRRTLGSILNTDFGFAPKPGEVKARCSAVKLVGNTDIGVAPIPRGSEPLALLLS